MRVGVNRRWQLLAAGAVVSAAVSLVPLTASADPAPHEATQASVDQLRSTNGAPGTVAVARTGDSVWSVHSGTSALGGDKAIAPTDQFRIGSLTKPFTATVVLQLVGAGKVELDAPIGRYLPGVVTGKYDGNKITVRQLLQHTSGIADYLSTEVMINPLNQIFPHTLAEVASWGLKQDPMFAPGTRYGYSNTNYIIAGMLIEKVTGRSYGDEVTDRLIKPLGLTGTYLPKPGDHALHAPHVRGYVGQGLLVDFTEIIEPSMGLSGGGLVSTGADATRFIQALITGKLLPPALLNEMRKPNNLPGTAPGYGLGVDVFPLPCGGQAWGHYGIWPGYQTIVAATEDGRSAFVGMNVLQLAPGGSASFSGGGEVIGRNQTMVTALCDR